MLKKMLLVLGIITVCVILGTTVAVIASREPARPTYSNSGTAESVTAAVTPEQDLYTIKNGRMEVKVPLFASKEEKAALAQKAMAKFMESEAARGADTNNISLEVVSGLEK